MAIGNQRMTRQRMDNLNRSRSCAHCANDGWVVLDSGYIRPTVSGGDESIIVAWDGGDGMQRKRVFRADEAAQVVRFKADLERVPLIERAVPCPMCRIGMSTGSTRNPRRKDDVNQAPNAFWNEATLQSASWNGGMTASDVSECRNAGCRRPASAANGGIRCTPCERSYAARQRGINPAVAGREYLAKHGVTLGG